MQPAKIEARIAQIKQELQRIGLMRPGSLSKQYSVCGKPGCHCVDPAKPRKHGPYYQLSYVHQGRSTTQFIRSQFVSEVKTQLANYKRYRRLTNQWVALALQLAKWRLEQAKRRTSD